MLFQTAVAEKFVSHFSGKDAGFYSGLKTRELACLDDRDTEQDQSV
jgi:hypothetical protein